MDLFFRPALVAVVAAAIAFCSGYFGLTIGATVVSVALTMFIIWVFTQPITCQASIHVRYDFTHMWVLLNIVAWLGYALANVPV